MNVGGHHVTVGRTREREDQIWEVILIFKDYFVQQAWGPLPTG